MRVDHVVTTRRAGAVYESWGLALCIAGTLTGCGGCAAGCSSPGTNWGGVALFAVGFVLALIGRLS